jgi:ankyrin repeat protein
MDARKQPSTFLIMGLISMHRKTRDSLLCLLLLNKGFTPLLAASSYGHLPFVDLLILHGADLHLANIEGATPLMMAAKSCHLEVVKLLVERGAVVELVVTRQEAQLLLKLLSLVILR